MTEEVVLSYLNDYQIITFPKILTMCTLYQQTNKGLLQKIIELYFSKKFRVKYTKEINKVIDHALLVLEMVGGYVCGFEENSKIIPIGIRTKPQGFDPYWIDEVVTYILDMASILSAFLSNYKPALELASKTGLPFRLSYFYNRVYQELYIILKKKYKLPYDWEKLEERIFDRLALGRSEFISVFHLFITECIDKIVQLQ